MSRNRTILLNKANKALKLIRNGSYNTTINWSNIKIIFPGKTSISWDNWEDIILMFKKENISWEMNFENNNLTLTIYL